MTRPELIAKITSYVNLEFNWDGYGAIPTTHKCVERALYVISKLDDVHISIATETTPCPNGTVVVDFESQQGLVSVEFGENTFGYILRMNGNYSGVDDFRYESVCIALLISDIIDLL